MECGLVLDVKLCLAKARERVEAALEKEKQNAKIIPSGTKSTCHVITDAKKAYVTEKTPSVLMTYARTAGD